MLNKKIDERDLEILSRNSHIRFFEFVYMFIFIMLANFKWFFKCVQNVESRRRRRRCRDDFTWHCVNYINIDNSSSGSSIQQNNNTNSKKRKNRIYLHNLHPAPSSSFHRDHDLHRAMMLKITISTTQASTNKQQHICFCFVS